MYRPPLAYHCKECDACIEVFDHHCYMLNNCIGYHIKTNRAVEFNFIKIFNLITKKRSKKLSLLFHSINEFGLLFAVFDPVSDTSPRRLLWKLVSINQEGRGRLNCDFDTNICRLCCDCAFSVLLVTSRAHSLLEHDESEIFENWRNRRFWGEVQKL